MQNALKNALRRRQLQPCFALRHRADVRMGEAVVADLVAFVPDAPHEIGISLGVLSDEKERRFHVVLLQLIEHLGGIWLGRTVIDRQRNESGLEAGPRDHIRRGELVIRLVDCDPCFRIDFQRS